MSRSVWGYGGVFQQYWLCALVAVLKLPWCLTSVSPAVAEELPRAGTVFRARDTLDTSADGLQDAQHCLEGLRWKPADFEVRLEVPRDNEGDLLVRFPSPVSSGNGINDLVSMEWYAARDKDRRPCAADCVIVVHESGRGMTVGRIFARGLNAQGLHTFLIHLPGYGARRTPDAERAEKMLDGLKQAVADVRRARDAAASLPLISGRVFGVQGTSLGGFVTSTAGGLDAGFDRVFILLAGGNLHDVVLQGQKDAAKVRQRLEALGVKAEQIRELARPVEPLRVAHRLRPESTWLYSGKYDDVVPPACSHALAKAAKLPAGHHIEMAADHYSGILYLPAVIAEIRTKMNPQSVADMPAAGDDGSGEGN